MEAQTTISIQIWKDTADVWDDIRPAFLRVANPQEAAQIVANATCRKVRMTISKGDMPVTRLSGEYFTPVY
jgi:hypothetical protein